MTTVRLVSGQQHGFEEKVSVSLEQTPLVLADVRRKLPQLRKNLQKKWPVLYVDIENRLPQLHNPSVPGEIVTAACIVLTVTFAHNLGATAGKEIGKAVGKTIGQEVSKFIRNWVKARADTPSRRKARR
jgi:hypothetical protein